MRVALGLAALAFAAAAFVVAPPPPATGGDPLSALGTSLGGLRVAVVDVAFIRAERLRRQGLVEELPALYGAVQRLDPGNAAAADYLAAIYAYDLMSDAPDTDARFSWWREAWKVVEAALRDHPEDASLLMRSSDLLLDVAPRDPALERRVARLVDRPRRLGIARLAEAARVTPLLPRRGRLHLLRLAYLLPVAAASAMHGGEDEWRALVDEGEALLALRRADFASIRGPSEIPGEGLPLDEVFASRLALVANVGAARAAGDEAKAASLLRAWRAKGLDPVLAGTLADAEGDR